GEAGVAARLAAELLPGEAVGVEIKLPMSADPLRTRALVRHHDKLQAGMEFVGLSAAQQTAIRVWAGTATPKPTPVQPSIPIKAVANDSESGRAGSARHPPRKRRSRTWIFFVISAAILLGIVWWR